jgi:hypothetical protein
MDVVVRFTREEVEELFTRVLQSAEPDNPVTVALLRKLADSLAQADVMPCERYVKVA